MAVITITAHAHSFTFPVAEEGSAWYDLDQAAASSDGWSLRINADREVYACLTDPAGAVFFGTIGDEEDDQLADNFPVSPGETYLFFDHPETEHEYL